MPVYPWLAYVERSAATTNAKQLESHSFWQSQMESGFKTLHVAEGSCVQKGLGMPN